MSPADIITTLEIITVVLLGLSFGSFATVLAHRGKVFSLSVKDREENTAARSFCPHCKNKLKIIDLVPVFSWLIQKGRCRYCSKRISPLYPFIEIAVLCMGLGYFYIYGFDPVSQMLASYAAFSILVGLFVFDIRFKILPNNLVAALALIGLFYRLWPSHLEGGYNAQIIEYGAGGIIYALFIWLMGLVMHKVLGRQALGMGDVKFFGAAGLWLGLSNFDEFCVLSGVFGVVLGVFWKRFRGEDAFPFGPALILSFFVLLLLDGSHLL